MSERAEVIDDHSDDVSSVSHDSLDDTQRESLRQLKIKLERDLKSVTAKLQKPKSRSVPQEGRPSVHSSTIRANSQRGAVFATPISHEPTFLGFSHLSPPFFQQFGTSNANVWIQTERNEPIRKNRTTPAEMSTASSVLHQSQHNTRDNINASNKSSHSSRSLGLKHIDEWVENVCAYNAKRNSTRSSISTASHKSSHINQQREKVGGSTRVELPNTSTSAPRYGECGVDRVDRSELATRNSTTAASHILPHLNPQRNNDRGSMKVELLNPSTVVRRCNDCGSDVGSNSVAKRNSSMDPDGVNSRDIVSEHRSQWGSTKVELLNASSRSSEQYPFNECHSQQSIQRVRSTVDRSTDPPAFVQPNLRERQVEQLNVNRTFCCKVSHSEPQDNHGRGSTRVELPNASPCGKFCGSGCAQKIDQKDQVQVSCEIPGQVHGGKCQFPYMGVPNHHNCGQSLDQQGCKPKIRPLEDQQRNFSSDNRTQTRENRDRHEPQDGPTASQQNNVSQPDPSTPTPVPQTPIETNNAIMTKLASRQVLGKDLPEYSGEVSKWLAFIDQYNDSTENCQYTDRENIGRLRKCLKGKAYDLVEPLLVSSTNAKTIIKVLERRFGRPDDIVKWEIKRVKEIQSPKENDPHSIITFATAVQNLVVTLETLKKIDHLRNPVLLDDLQDKLPPTLNLLWSEYIVDRKEDLTLRVLADWLDRRAEAASRRTTFNVYEAETATKQKYSKARVNTVNTVSNPNACFSCHGTCTSLASCEAFSKLDVRKRWDIAKKNKLCFFCLATSHQSKDCMKKAECKIKGCKRFHHRLLHSPSTKVGIISSNYMPHVTKLRIVPVVLYGQSTEIKTFALLDPGSTSTLMSDRLSNLLKLDGPNAPLLLEWMNGDMAVENDSKIVNTKIQGTYDGAKIYDLFNVRTVKNLPLHKQTIDKKALVKQWSYLRTVEFEGYEDAQKELLIGENNGLLIATRQLVHDKWNMPIASKTWLGWVISGNDGKSAESNVVKIFTAQEVERDSLYQLVKSSFNLENAGVSSQKLTKSKEDERAMKMLDKYSQKIDNRWETGLLWRDENVILPESRKNAFLRLMILEKKLDKDPQLRQRYNEIIEEYLEKKFLRKVEKTDPKFQNTWYLPHFPVLYPLKPGKVRIVFDAAAKSNGFCLNDYLMPGPDLLKPLISILFKFRHGYIGILGDIKDMFHRINMRPQDASCQRILWRGDDRTGEPQEYELDVMSFGANCSPCSAIHIKDKNAKEYQDTFPEAVDAILNKHYMDDYLDSTNSEEEAITKINDVSHVHRQGSFEIRNWVSSSQAVMQTIPEHLRRHPSSKVNLDHENLPDRVLGILWDPVEDVFTFNADFAKIDKRLMSGEKKPTKRDVLSIINSVFDPLGFVAHLMIIGKIILRKIWLTGTDWNDEIDDKSFEAWKSFLDQMQRITEVKLDRCYSINFLQAENLQLHVFCDASTEAYSAVAFVRIQVGDQVEVKFVMAKTRVAPTKSSSLNTLTIPRLELEAALLGSRMSETIIEEHDVKFDQLVLWTDNAAVWYWIKSETKRYKQFVANRLDEILELTKSSNWMWVPTDLNPADDATRSNKIPQFNNDARWYRGPEFLYRKSTDWPVQPNKRIELTADLVKVLEFSNFVVEKPISPLLDSTRFSKWQRLLRSTSWILQFVNNCKKNRAKSVGFELTVDETNTAEMLLVKDSQRRCFPTEIADLQKGKNVHINSRLYNLCPKMDENGILRMYGRTTRLPDTSRGIKEPVILDGKDYLVKLIIRFFHENANHFGHEMVLNEIRQRYWIIGAKIALRSVRHSCNKCKLLLAKPSPPIMGQLPLARITSGHPPYTFCGVDYFGPILVKVKRSTEKRYGVLFTCLTVRAVHIEIASSLTTDSCTMALRRFIAKHICPQEMYSDNGTNLRGCDNELRENLMELDQDKIRGEMTKHRIKWFFNPPTAASMGGSWERLVRSIKTALYATLESVHPSDEVLATLLAEAQHVTNSRPLLEISDHPHEEETLTPNHFLIGRSSASAPIGEFDSSDLILKKQWRAAQYLSDLFWKRWVKEFLPTLTKRTKWFRSGRTPEIGELVLIADSDEKRGNWPRGIITAVFPGIDDEVRVVDVTTHTGTYRRPMNKICLLESTLAAREDV